MTINVTENPVGIPQTWSIPAESPGVPMGQLVFQNTNVSVGAPTAEDVAITINGALPIGYAYRIVDAYMDLRAADVNDLDQFSRQAQLQLQAFNPTSPAQTIIIRQPMVVSDVGLVNNRAVPNVLDSSATPKALLYSAPNLTSVPLTAQHATTVFQIAVGATPNTANAGVLGYYVRFLFYSINENEKWALHTPQLVV